jgi:hypothetical protein
MDLRRPDPRALRLLGDLIWLLCELITLVRRCFAGWSLTGGVSRLLSVVVGLVSFVSYLLI